MEWKWCTLNQIVESVLTSTHTKALEFKRFIGLVFKLTFGHTVGSYIIYIAIMSVCILL